MHVTVLLNKEPRADIRILNHEHKPLIRTLTSHFSEAPWCVLHLRLSGSMEVWVTALLPSAISSLKSAALGQPWSGPAMFSLRSSFLVLPALLACASSEDADRRLIYSLALGIEFRDIGIHEPDGSAALTCKPCSAPGYDNSDSSLATSSMQGLRIQAMFSKRPWNLHEPTATARSSLSPDELALGGGGQNWSPVSVSVWSKQAEAEWP